ncbi:MAG: EamA family transporter [Alphaproteobacteria bacterium]|nr:EamA family transporter [Alphaproteobacteria bacterium]
MTKRDGAIWIAYAQVAASFVLVGISVPLAKLMVRDLPIFLACGVRFVAAVAIALPLLWWRGESLANIAPRDHRLLFSQALPGVFLFPVLLFQGLKTANGTAAGVILGAMPAVVAVLAVLLLRERPALRVWIGVALAAAAMILLELQNAGSTTGADGWGVLLVIAAVFAEALYTVLARSLGGRVSPVAVCAWLSLFGLIAFTPFALVDAQRIDLASVSWTSWASAVYYGIFPSVTSFLLFYSAIRRIEAANAGVFTSLMPLTAILLSIAMLGEVLSMADALGALLVFAALALIVMPARKKVGSTGRI